MVVHLVLTFLMVYIFTISRKSADKARRALTLSVFLLFLYWALMYDYGLDYWSYFDIFYNDRHYGEYKGEPLYWNLFFLFPSFYLFVVFYSFVLSSTIYYFVKYNIPTQYYALFFLIYMLHPSLCLNMTYVMRSAIGSCIVWLAFSKYYIKKENYFKLYLLIGAAALCHHTLALCLVLPVACYLTNKIPWPLILGSLIVALWLGTTQSKELFVSLFGGMDSFEAYAHYGEDRIKEVSFVMILSRAIHLVPAFFILYYRNTNEYTKRLSGMCMIYYLVYFLGFDMLGRLTMMLYVFVIMCTILIADNKRWFIKMCIIFPSILFATYRNVMFYMEMATSYKGMEGNMMEYKTILSTIF